MQAVQRALAERGMSQKNLAQAIGTSSQAVTNWLKGEDFPRPASLLSIATTLGLGIKELVMTGGDADRPVIAYRKKANAKTTGAHVAKAEGIGMLLKPLVAYLPNLQALRTLITAPSTDYARIENVIAQVRRRLGIGDQAVLEYEHLIGEFEHGGAVLVPVLWGAKGNHENALHIRLPREDVTFIFLNLDTHLEDFKFWMAHELAHVLTPELSGTNDGEDFADAFAGALLFPRACAERAYREIVASNVLDVLRKYAHEHLISLNTVFKQTQAFAAAEGLPPLAIEEGRIHAARNSARGPLVGEALFDPMPPSPERYIAACENTFRTGFFQALRQMIRATGTGPAYVQQILDAPMRDAHALFKALSD